MAFSMTLRIKRKENYVCISMKEIWRNLEGLSKNKELWSYVVSFEFSRPKVAQTGPSRCRVVSLGCPYEPRIGPDSYSRGIATKGRLDSNYVYTRGGVCFSQ